jgi:hypothetical protein
MSGDDEPEGVRFALEVDPPRARVTWPSTERGARETIAYRD